MQPSDGGTHPADSGTAPTPPQDSAGHDPTSHHGGSDRPPEGGTTAAGSRRPDPTGEPDRPDPTGEPDLPGATTDQPGSLPHQEGIYRPQVPDPGDDRAWDDGLRTTPTPRWQRLALLVGAAGIITAIAAWAVTARAGSDPAPHATAATSPRPSPSPQPSPSPTPTIDAQAQ